MRNLLAAAASAALMMTTAGVATAQSDNNANANAPGQDRTCLVTTKNPGSFNDADVSSTKWLPRKAAEQQASKSPDTMKVFNYGSDPLVGDGKQYATAEDLCNNHFK
jgi:hypothetical protein